jgi:putative SOS response-associated peptidase YedK
MCTRYASDLTMDDWAKLYDLAMEGPPPWNFEPSYNVTLTQTIPVVVSRDGRRVLERMRWGIIPHKHKGTIKDHKRDRRMRATEHQFPVLAHTA